MILNKSAAPCEGEVSVKTYLCTEFNSRVFGINAQGYLEVTNKRLLFQALGKSMSGWSVIHSEVAIQDVSEIKIYKGNSFNILLFILGIVVSLALAVMLKGLLFISMRMESVGTLLALAGFVFAVYWLYQRCRKEAFSMLINTKGGSGNVVYLAGLSPFGGGTSAASKALQAAPGKDSEIMFREIGAVILDIQHMGENAIQKWKK